MATITVSKGLIGKEDIQFETAGAGTATFSRTTAGGGTQSITKLGARHIPLEDSGGLITATNVESALQELQGYIDALEIPVTGGQGADIASSSTIVLPSRHLYFDVTGTLPISAITPDADSTSTNGRIVVLRFDDTITIKDGYNLQLEGDFNAQPNDILGLMTVTGSTLAHVWKELFRSTRHSDDMHGGLTAAMDDRLGPVFVLPGHTPFLYSQQVPDLNLFVGGAV